MSEQSTRVMPQQREAGSLSPAFMSPESADVSYQAVPIFNSPVAGNTDTGVTHTGDLGGAGAR